MTDNFPHSAAQNIALLEAIQQGPAESLSQLALRADVAVNNMNRKLGVLTEDGLIVKVGEATHEVDLTEAGRQALVANAVFRGEAPATGNGITEIPFNLIDPWAGNPRTQFDPAKTEELALSIADKGVLQAIKVRPKGDRYEVIIGERRRRASALAVERGWQPADFAIACDVRDYTDEEAEEVAGVENMQREDMHWMDEAKWYLSLSHRHSGASIERLVGGIRGKRSIQDYIKCARELTPEDVAKTYLPDGHKDQLTYVRARDLVGEKKERPALELSPKLAVALLETIACGIAQANGETGFVSSVPLAALALPAPGATVVTRFAKAPVGGPLSTLVERKLLEFGFEAREVVARTKLGEDVLRWLTQLGFHEDPHGALYRARAAVVGEIQTHALEREGRCFTSELNGPQRPADGMSAVEQQRQLAEGRAHEFEDDDEQLDLDPEGFGAQGHDDDDEATPDYLLRLAGGGSAATPSAAQPAGPTPQRMVEASPTDAAAASPPPAPAAPEPLPAMLEIVVLEVAHKLGRAALKSPAGGMGVPILANYYKDGRVGTLVQGRGLLAVHPSGEKTLAIQNANARAFLVDNYGLEEDDGIVTLGDALLAEVQMKLLGAKPVPGPYSTPWLNPPAAPEAAAEAKPETPDPLTPSQRRVLREIAARSLHRYRLLDGWVQAHAAATEDPDFQALYDLAFISHQNSGQPEFNVALTLAGRDHLKARGQAPQDGLSRNSCATPWLREDAPAPKGAAAESALGAAEARAFAALASAARQAAALLNQLKGRTKAPKAEEIDPMVRLLETALEACTPLLGKDDHV